MEFPVSGAHEYAAEGDHYHDANQHGLVWAAMHELLHVIVFVFRLFGMISFQVKFIKAPRLVSAISKLIIAFNWYLAIKYFLMAIVFYLYNSNLERRSIQISSLNCTLANYPSVLQASIAVAAAGGRANNTHGTTSGRGLHALFKADHLDRLTWLVDTYGGPYKLLGNMATLIYGVYAIAIYIMLALFPAELIFRQVGFNFIRFVLSDQNCMNEMYARRKRHAERLAAWKRYRADTNPNGTVEIVVSPRVNSRFNAVAGPAFSVRVRLAAAGQRSRHDLPGSASSPRPLGTEVATTRSSSSGGGLRPATPVPAGTNNRLGGFVAVASSSDYSRARCVINQLNKPSYLVRIALRNLRRFKPFVRSDNWFRASMIIYPAFIFYTFIIHMFACSQIQVYLDTQLSKTLHKCGGGEYIGAYFKQMSFMDWLCYYEHFYCVFVLSCASSFYISYFFSTILELAVWLGEITQQLILCTRVVEITSSLADEPPVAGLTHLEARQMWSEAVPAWVNFYVNDYGGFVEILPHWMAKRAHKKVGKLNKYKMHDLMAVKLLTRRETLLRAAYVNMHLFIDELEETRFMITTMLLRLAYIVAGFASMAAITRSQFNASYLNLNILLISTFFIYNIYLACAALINNRINRMYARIHSLMAAIVRTKSEDVDILDFWSRHINSIGLDTDSKAYTILGLKVTWSTILSIDAAFSTVFFLTL